MYWISDETLERMLRDDAPYGDLTSAALGISAQPGRATLTARQTMTVACIEEAERMFALRGGAAERRCASGDAVAAGAVLLTAQGPAGGLHLVYKVAQTLLEYAAGIATRARRIVDAARAVAPGIAVACTRKHLPGTKEIPVRAVTAGGAVMHRLSLSETVLVFAEHRAFLDGNLAAHVSRLRRHCPEKTIVAEAAALDEAERLALAGVDFVQLDKLAPDVLRVTAEAIRRAAPACRVIATGGITEANAAAYAAAGADLLVTSAPYQAPPLDVKVTLDPEEIRMRVSLS